MEKTVDTSQALRFIGTVQTQQVSFITILSNRAKVDFGAPFYSTCLKQNCNHDMTPCSVSEFILTIEGHANERVSELTIHIVTFTYTSDKMRDD